MRSRTVAVSRQGRRADSAVCEGARELSDFVHWHYDDNNKQTDAPFELDAEELDDPEWQHAAKFQLPLDMRRTRLKFKAFKLGLRA